MPPSCAHLPVACQVHRHGHTACNQAPSRRLPSRSICAAAVAHPQHLMLAHCPTRPTALTNMHLRAPR